MNTRIIYSFILLFLVLASCTKTKTDTPVIDESLYPTGEYKLQTKNTLEYYHRYDANLDSFYSVWTDLGTTKIDLDVKLIWIADYTFVAFDNDTFTYNKGVYKAYNVRALTQLASSL